MLNSTISKPILDHITKGDSMPTSRDVYLGLLTQLPTNPENPKNPEPPDLGYAEVSLSGYSRIPLGTKGASKEGMHGVTYFTGAVYDSEHKYFKTVTQEDIQMPSILQTEEGQAAVKGFGLFSAATEGTLLAWGELIDPDTEEPDTVTLTGGSVPIFYAGDFELRLS